MIKEILDYLDLLYPNPKCELNYNQDYELLLAIILSAQATDKGVNKVTSVLFDKYKSLEELNRASINDIEEIIRPIGTYKRKSQYIKEVVAILVNLGYKHVPNDREFIESLPGVGHKTANVFLSNIYDEAAIAVDTHVSRVSKRLGLVYKNDDVVKIEKRLMKKIPKDRWSKFHHQMVLFGRYKCKAIKPECEECLLKDICKNKK